MTYALTDRDIKDGFWRHRQGEGFPPGIIQHPDEYDGSPRVNIVCTRTNRPAREQAKSVRRWCDFLATVTELEFLWFSSRVPQEVFDAACTVSNLKGLWVKWSSIKTIGSIAGAPSLMFLHLGSSPQLTSVEPLRRLGNLIWLELENIKRVSDFPVIGELRQLRGLAIEGSMWTTLVVDSLAPLAQLQELRHLSLANLRAKDKTLSPLFSLSSLEHFHAAQWWTKEEVSQLCRANPKL
jgi:hypothetical protein